MQNYNQHHWIRLSELQENEKYICLKTLTQICFFPRHHHESWICLFPLCFIPHHVWLLPAQVMHSMFVGFSVRRCVCTRGWSGCYNQCWAWNMASRWGSPGVAAGDPFWDFTGSKHDWWRRQISVKLSMELLVFCFFFTMMWFQFCLFQQQFSRTLGEHWC